MTNDQQSLSDRISERTREAMAERKRAGAHMGRGVSPEFLNTYRKVLELHSQGLSLNAIAKELTAQGIPTATGGNWHASTVHRIVNSETAKHLNTD